MSRASEMAYTGDAIDAQILRMTKKLLRSDEHRDAVAAMLAKTSRS